MNVVGKFGSLISQGVYSVATPFHPFGGAVDIIVVQQQDGTFRSTPWYVRFGKFQGVLKGTEKMVGISVNGVEADFQMHLDNSGEAYFLKEVDPESGGDSKDLLGTHRLEHSVSDSGIMQLRNELESSGSSKIDRCESDLNRRFYDFQDDEFSQDGSQEDSSEHGSSRFDEQITNPDQNSEVVLISVDGHILTAPILDTEKDTKDIELRTPHLHLGPGEGADFCEENDGFGSNKSAWVDDYIDEVTVESESGNNLQKPNGVVDGECHNQEIGTCNVEHEGEFNVQEDAREKLVDVFGNCLEFQELAKQEVSEDSNGPGVEVNNTSSIENEVQAVQKDFLVEFSQSPPSVDVAADGPSLEANKTPLKENDVEMIENDAPSSKEEQAVSVSVSDNHLLPSDVELEDGQDSCLVVDKTMNEIPETGDSEGQCSPMEAAEVEKTTSIEEILMHPNAKIEISLCGNELHPGMGNAAAAQAFDKHRVSMVDFQTSIASIVKNENLIIRYRGKYMPWEKAAPIVLGMAAFDLDLHVDSEDTISVEEGAVKPSNDDNIDSGTPTTPSSSGRRWRLWRIPFRRVKTLEHQNSNSSSEDVFVDPEPLQHFQSEPTLELNSSISDSLKSPHKTFVRTSVPTTEQIASLNLKEGQNMITFNFSTRVLGKQQVDANIYLWMWNERIVISDVDGTITKSDVLGQFMPLVGKDWTQSGVARLFSAIKENGYQLLFLSARAIVQAYLTRSFLLNLKQDGKALPSGPIVISPDGLFPSLYREVIRRAPHEFKIACLEDIKALFPADNNPFYAGFGNRDTDEFSYMKIGIPKGKIFIINPKGEVANSHRIDVKSYTSLHTLVNDMFPPTSLVEQEDYNSWNFWRMPLPDIEC